MFEIHEKGKTREVADLPYFPDRLIHQAYVQVAQPTILKNLIYQSYAALPGKGSHQALRDVCRALQDDRALYYVQIDIVGYFKHILGDVLIEKLEARFKDEGLKEICRTIIEEYPRPGIPIGNYTSQYWANFYLSDLDHYMKEQFHCKWYFRYMDDIVIIGWSKAWLRRCLHKIEQIIEPWGLQIKSNWCIRPTYEGIDFVGYVSYRTKEGEVYVLLRKRTKTRMKRACRTVREHMEAGLEPTMHDKGVVASYYGVLSWCNGYYLGMKTVYPLMEYVGIHKEIEVAKWRS